MLQDKHDYGLGIRYSGTRPENEVFCCMNLFRIQRTYE